MCRIGGGYHDVVFRDLDDRAAVDNHVHSTIDNDLDGVRYHFNDAGR